MASATQSAFAAFGKGPAFGKGVGGSVQYGSAIVGAVVVANPAFGSKSLLGDEVGESDTSKNFDGDKVGSAGVLLASGGIEIGSMPSFGSGRHFIALSFGCCGTCNLRRSPRMADDKPTVVQNKSKRDRSCLIVR